MKTHAGMNARATRFWIGLGAALLIAGGAAAGIFRLRQARAEAGLPAAPARQGDFLVIVRCRGELRARRSVGIYAPVVPGLRIAWLAPNGEVVKEGEPIIRFDSSTSQQQLMQKEAQLKQAQATLDQAAAQARITADQDKTDFADAQYTVERARIEAARQEVLHGKIQGDESRVDLAVAEEKLKVEQATVNLHAASDKSKIASLTRQRDQASDDVSLTKSRIAQMEIKSPLTGFLQFSVNYSQGYLDAKPFKVGDNVWSGMELGEIPDLATLEMEGKIEEVDRGRIALNQDVRVRVDALPELALPAKVNSFSPLAEQSWEFPVTRSFRAYASIAHPDPRLRPGMNGGMDVVVDRIPGAISIPTKALFTRAGKPVVYLASGGHYSAAEVKVLARNPDEVAVSGIPPGSMVTLVDVEQQKGAKK
jgi:HlyD family secretion protein